MHEGRERKTFQFSITESMELMSYEDLVVKQNNKRTPEVILETSRPLVLLLPWLLAKPKHTRKYVELYLDKGFDVLTISITVWKVIWPMIGAQEKERYGVNEANKCNSEENVKLCKLFRNFSQAQEGVYGSFTLVVATDIVEFLRDHENFQPLFVHGFSAGNYLWSEALVKISGNMERYKSVMDRVRGQVFDSPPSTPPAFQRGFAMALFPNNALLSCLFEYAISLQLYLFYNIVTKHIINGYEAVLRPPSKVPCLMFISKDDPISPFDRNMDVMDVWRSNGIEAQVKWWDKSQHVGHFVQHRSEYLEQLNSLLESVGLSNLKRSEQIPSTTVN